MLTPFSVLETLTAVVQNTAMFLESWYQSCCSPGALVFGTHMLAVFSTVLIVGYY